MLGKTCRAFRKTKDRAVHPTPQGGGLRDIGGVVQDVKSMGRTREVGETSSESRVVSSKGKGASYELEVKNLSGFAFFAPKKEPI